MVFRPSYYFKPLGRYIFDVSANGGSVYQELTFLLMVDYFYRGRPLAHETLVTFGSDGFCDYCKLPDGRIFTLGSVSILKFVTELAKNASTARKALNAFLKHGEAVMGVELDKLEKVLKRPRSRWATVEANDLSCLEESFVRYCWAAETDETPLERKIAVLERTARLLSSAESRGDHYRYILGLMGESIKSLSGTA